jgi:hypothetical protein
VLDYPLRFGEAAELEGRGVYILWTFIHSLSKNQKTKFLGFGLLFGLKIEGSLLVVLVLVTISYVV